MPAAGEGRKCRIPVAIPAAEGARNDRRGGKAPPGSHLLTYNWSVTEATSENSKAGMASRETPLPTGNGAALAGGPLRARLARCGRALRRYFVFVVGFTIVLIGVAMIVLPGPAVVVIPIGLAILATEFVWAKHLLLRAKRWLTKPARKANANRTRRRRQKRLQRRRVHRQRFTAG